VLVFGVLGGDNSDVVIMPVIGWAGMG
jgi:hypothetical protein